MAGLSQVSYDKLLKDGQAKGYTVDQINKTAADKGIALPTVSSAPTPPVATVAPAVQQINTQTVGTQKVTPVPQSTTGNTSTIQPQTSKRYTAPNGKEYTIFSDGTQVRFDGGFGKKVFQNEAALISEINAQNPVGSQYSKGIGSGEVTGQIQTQKDMLSQDLAGLKQEGLQGQQGLNQRLETLVPATIESDTSEIINKGVEAAKNALVSARQLEGEAQTIFGEGQIKAQAADMVKRGLDPAKAGQAALFLNLKGRSNLMAKVKQIQSEFDKQISNLEMQRTQLLVDAKNRGVENEKWVQDKAQSIESSIQNIKNDYQSNVGGLVEKYTIQPLVNVQSTTYAQDAQNVAQDIQGKFDTSTPQRKMMALQRVFGDNFAYVGNGIMDVMDLPFDQLTLKAAEMIRTNMKK